NMCIEVISRDPEGASIDAWDSQFFITMPEALKAGDKYQLEMRVRADKAARASTQSHDGPSQYLHYIAVGDVNFTTEWATFKSQVVTVSGAMVGMRSIAFNLAELKEANKYYFDDIKITLEKAPVVTTWKNIMVNGDLEGDDYSGIVCREKGQGDAANVVAGVGVNGSKAAVINSAADAANSWDTQFFVFVPQKLAAGTQYKIKFSVRSEADATISTQTHSTPGNYLGGAFGNFDSKADWTVIEKEGSIGSDDTQTIAFNLNENLTLATKFYFDNIEFYIAE
ncbi:MAG: carbohydrate binding domain-containing protein, partial [Prevotella sp.]|nr:carbohydrate binding domain-containing protein [Prevotella sp.]